MAGRASPGLTIGQLLARDLERRRSSVRRSTWQLSEYLQRLHILPYLGDLPLADLDRETIQAWHERLDAKGLSPSYRAKIHGHLNRSLVGAVDRGLIPRNPADGLTPTVPEPDSRPYLDLAQLDTLLEHSDPLDPVQLVWRMAVYTGMRQGELFGLTWAHVNLGAGSLRVRQALIRPRGEPWYLAPPKTRRARRTITLPQAARDELAAWRRRQIERRLAQGSAWRDYDLVFTRLDGDAIHPQTVYNRLKRFCRWHDLPETISMHALRRTHATWLAALGEHPSIVQHRLGHTSPALTLAIYTEVSEGMDRHAAGLIDRDLDPGEQARDDTG